MNIAVVIDDDPAIRRLLRRLLAAQGWIVHEATDGRAGIDLVGAHTPNLVVTDLLMREECGLGVLRALKPLDSGLAVIAISGAGTLNGLDYLKFATDLGACCVLRKPFDPDQFADALGAAGFPVNPETQP